MKDLTEEAIKKLLNTGICTEKELDHIYRYLCKVTHPDTSGRTGEHFLQVKEFYEEAQRKLRAGTAPAEESSDFRKISRAFGYHHPGEPRIHLYIALKRYYALGLYSMKMRLRESGQRRNREILEIIEYWGDLYTPEGASLFLTCHHRLSETPESSLELNNRRYVRHQFLQGIANFWKYQGNGKEGPRRIAESTFRHIRRLDRFILPSDDPQRELSAWFLRELEKPPLMLDILI